MIARPPAFAVVGVVLLLALVSSGAMADKSDNHPRIPYFGSDSSQTDDEMNSVFPKLMSIVDGFDSKHASTFQMSSYPAAATDGQSVVISYSGVANATKDDFIIASCGPINPVLGLNDYLDYRVVNNVTYASGSGSVRFISLIMMRCTYKFTYVHSVNGEKVAIGSVEVPMKEPWSTPKQGHISFSDNVDEMWVSFNSDSTETPVVKYGLDPNHLDMTAQGTSNTYAASDMCNAPANTTSQQTYRDPGHMHHTLLKKLKPNGVKYYYQFGNDQDGYSDVFSFVSRTAPGGCSVQHGCSTQFIAYADMGCNPPPAALTTANRVELEVLENGYDDFLLHFGDISYARSAGYWWDYWFHLVSPLMTKIPYLVSVGNHEYDHEAGGQHDPSHAPGNGFHPSWGNMGSDSAGECAIPVVNRFKTPTNGNGLFWYSFNAGFVHVIMMSTEHDWTQGSEQYKWIEADLAAVDRSVTPWVILTGHRMMYTTQLKEEGDYIVSEYMKAQLEDLIYKYKVNLMFTGHQHSYERSCAVYQKQCRPDGLAPVHIVVGSAGAGLESGGFSSQFGNYSVAHTNSWGYCRVKATKTSFDVEFVMNDSGDVWDQVSLKPWQ